MKEISLGNLSIPVITPKKGVDYYTSAEKQEIVEEVTNSVNSIIEPQEETRQTNEDQRILNENSRVAQERTRMIQEASRDSNEDTRQINESTRESQESTRENNETTRITNETARTSNETTRQSNESTRQTQESTRQSNETARVSNETTRQSNEGTRISNENRRVQNEQNREDYITNLQAKVERGDFKGDTGDDGVSPTVQISKSGKVTTITITDVDGVHTATINDGADGQGAGDMLKNVYDTNDNGIVDNAERVNNHTVQSDVPANAVFTDTVYDDTIITGEITALQVKTFSIATSAWTQNATTQLYEAIISDTSVNSYDSAEVDFNSSTYDIAVDAGIKCYVTEVQSTGIKLFADSVPSATVSGKYNVQRGVANG